MEPMPTETIERPDLDERIDTDTRTDERPDADATDHGDDDRPKFFHYVKKDKIAESAVMGNHVVALCGETFPVTRSAKPGSPVCPKCKKIYNRMRKS
jgi:hypothetical protein